MTKEEQKAFEKEMQDKYDIRLRFREEDDEFITNLKNSKSYKKKVTESNEILNSTHFPKGFFSLLNKKVDIIEKEVEYEYC